MGRLLVWREGDDLPRWLIQVLKEDGVAVIPTETLYALAARAFSPDALELVYEIKGRERGKALSLFFSGVEDLERYFHFTPLAKRLAERFLPGPLTLVLKPKRAFPPPLVGPTGGVGVRVPGHPLPRMVVEALGEPITATSANVSGGEDPLTVEELPGSILSKVALVVDGGRVPGVPSTVVDLTRGTLRVLRGGVLSVEEVEEAAYG